MPAVDLATLLIQETKTAIYNTAIGVAEALGLPVSSWQAGDPTRSLYHLEAEILAKLEEVVVGFIQSGFLDYATGDWLKVNAEQVYDVTVPAATAASTDVVLTNTGGGFYEIEAGDLVLKNSTSGATYRNTTGGTLNSGPGTELTITVVAEELGSAGSAAAGEIDTLVTGLLGVTCTNALAAVGVDEQDEAVTRQQCRDKLGPLSPNGPKEAYAYVARSEDHGGTSAITRVRVYDDSDTGDVTVYLAGPSGAVSEADRALAENAILDWATPICITPTVVSAANVTVTVTYQLWVYKSVNKTADDIKEDVEDALEQMFADRPIGGDILEGESTGKLYTSMIESTIRSLYPQAFRVSLTSPSSDTALTNGQVAVVAVSPSSTVTLVPDP